MILRFAAEREIETSYAAWRLRHADAVQHRRGDQGARRRLPLPDWVAFIERHPADQAGASSTR